MRTLFLLFAVVLFVAVATAQPRPKVGTEEGGDGQGGDGSGKGKGGKGKGGKGKGGKGKGGKGKGGKGKGHHGPHLPPLDKLPPFVQEVVCETLHNVAERIEEEGVPEFINNLPEEKQKKLHEVFEKMMEECANLEGGEGEESGEEYPEDEEEY